MRKNWGKTMEKIATAKTMAEMKTKTLLKTEENGKQIIKSFTENFCYIIEDFRMAVFSHNIIVIMVYK